MKQSSIPVKIGRIKLGMEYAVCSSYFKSYIRLCFNAYYEHVYDKQSNAIQPFKFRVNSYLENSDINWDDIAFIVIPENPPWLNPKLIFNFELRKYKKI